MNAGAKYQEIANTLREEIDAHTWEVGTKLPAEPELIERFEASRTTIRQALAELRDAGLVRMQHGVGVFVAPPQVVQRLDSRERLSKARRDRNESAFRAEAIAQDFTPSSSVRVWFEAADEVAEILDCEPEDEVCVRDRVMRADGKPVMLATSRLPREITRGTPLEDVDTGSGGAHARLEDAGFPITHHEEIVGARLPDTNERSKLDLPSGAVLTIRRLTRSNHRVIEINDMVMSGAAYEARYGWDAD